MQLHISLIAALWGLVSFTRCVWANYPPFYSSPFLLDSIYFFPLERCFTWVSFFNLHSLTCSVLLLIFLTSLMVFCYFSYILLMKRAAFFSHPMLPMLDNSVLATPTYPNYVRGGFQLCAWEFSKPPLTSPECESEHSDFLHALPAKPGSDSTLNHGPHPSWCLTC